MMNRKIKDRLLSIVMLFILLILGWVLYILTNEIKADLSKTTKFFQVLGYVGIGFGVVTCVIRFLIGKPLIKTSLDKQIKPQQTESMMSELARSALTETKKRNRQIEGQIDDDLKETWQAAIALSMVIMIVGFLVDILILVS